MWFADDLKEWLWLHNGRIESVTRCPWCLGELPDYTISVTKAVFTEPDDAD